MDRTQKGSGLEAVLKWCNNPWSTRSAARSSLYGLPSHLLVLRAVGKLPLGGGSDLPMRSPYRFCDAPRYTLRTLRSLAQREGRRSQGRRFLPRTPLGVLRD